MAPPNREDDDEGMSEAERRAHLAARGKGASAASSQSLPRVAPRPVARPPSASSQALPPVKSSAPSLPPVAKPAPKSPLAPRPEPKLPPGAPPLNSEYVGETTKSTQRDLLLGRPHLVLHRPAQRPSLSHEELTAVASRFDGKKAAAAVQAPASQLRPLEAETNSTPGTRQALLTKAVLDQFACATNTRYAKGECGHVFVRDFARAMGCELPRFKGRDEMSLRDLCGWFRMLSSSHGWIRITAQARATELASRGFPVVAVPKNGKGDLIAIARPDLQAPDGTPMLASACSRARGAALTTLQAFNVRMADYFFHE